MAPGLKNSAHGIALSPGGRRRVISAGLLSVVAWVLLQVVAPPGRISWTGEMRSAAELMARGIERTSSLCQERGLPMELALDPNQTCLIGPQYTPLFTSLGQLEAKRTTTNPNLAGLLVHLLREAGVRPGDTVGVGASGSFPGLLLATLSAVEAMGAEATLVLSLGASSYGATRPHLNLLDMHTLWREDGSLEVQVRAVTLGGTRDLGLEFDEETREELREQVLNQGLVLLQEPQLRDNVAWRMALHGSVSAFVNVGGAHANLGVSSQILRVPAGLNMGLDPPPQDERGVLFEMAARGVPVIHLLHVRGLALQYGLPWDPVPLPLPGESALQVSAQKGGLGFWLLTGGFLSLLLLLFLFPATVRHQPE